MDTRTQSDLMLAIVVVVLGAAGTYLLLPHRHGVAKPRTMHIAGAILAGLGLLLFDMFWRPPGPFLTSLFFYAFSLAAVAGGLLMITTRNPIYSALWFASVVLSTSGLFLLSGAQFLAAGTVIVYAGAIIVTFLFVIMLAQMEGRATYDRAARSPFAATMSCFVLFWGLLYSLFLVKPPASVATGPNPAPPAAAMADASPNATRAPLTRTQDLGPGSVALARDLASRPTAQLNDAQGRPKPHVAGLGETLYTDHLVSVELAGTLLFVALIGAVAIATPKRPIRPGNREAAAPSPTVAPNA
ncbi:MAG: NADH-quinone oxidoreductase subunit J [Planctomycetaceae bacterium]|nr:NADH-quinone oxidoreductase subunit J [Planctomycetaceae bacterium]